MSPSGSPRFSRDVVFGALLFLAALGPRLYVALAWSGEPVWDGHYYDFGAHRIAEGFGYSDNLTLAGQLVWHPWCHYPVGYSAFLAGAYRLFGATHGVAAAANATVGALLAVVTWLLAREGMSATRARIAGALVAIHPGLVLYAALVMTEPLAALLTLLAFWVALAGTRMSGRAIAPRRAFLAAIVLGVAALVRPQALLCAPFLARATMRHRDLRAWTVAAIVALTPLVPILPWTARNCRVMDGCALVSTNGGWNLAIGAFERATGRFETLRSSDGCREVTGQVQQDRCWFAFGLKEIEDHPLRWLKLVPAKLGYTFDHESFAVEYLREARPEAWPEPRRVAWRAVTTFVERFLVVVAALACVGFRRAELRAWTQGSLLVALGALAYAGLAADAPAVWPLAVAAAVVPWLPIPGAPPWGWAMKLPLALLGTTVLTHAVFFGEDRYHVVVTPVLCLMAAAALRRSE